MAQKRKPTSKDKPRDKFGVESEFALDVGDGKLAPDSRTDPDLQSNLVAALYGTPKTIVYGCMIISGIYFASWLATGDAAYVFLCAVLFSISLLRYGAQIHYADAPKTKIPDLLRLEQIAAAGAWATAGVVGFSGGYTAFVHANEPANVLVAALVAAYAGGMSGRNASKPHITIGQSIATCVPFIIGLLASLQPLSAILATLVALNCYMTWSTVIGVHKTFITSHYATKKLHKIAHFDQLTGLSNRTTFLNELALITQQNEIVSIVSIDLDFFKRINDTFGHDVGDELLAAAAERIQDSIRPEDLAARIGGDEFLVIIRTADVLMARSAAIRILGTLNEPFTIRNASLKPGASIGFALRERGMSQEEILKHVDLALYSAKEEGRGQVRGYSEELKTLYDNRISLESDLSQAIGTNQLEMHYQPIVDPKTGKTVLAEALMRWKHPVRGMVPPAQFIPIAEATGLILKLGQWSLEKACSDASRLDADIGVSVNLSPVQFGKSTEIANVVRGALLKSGLEPSRLTLEVTESAMIEDVQSVIDTLKEIRALGVKIAMDDFGTGYSSLSMITDLPLDKLKVDRKFVQNLGRDRKGHAMMSAIAHIAKQLRLELIVEGVETVEQRDLVCEFDVAAIQGYLYSKPVPLAQLQRWIKDSQRKKDEDEDEAA